MEKGSSEKGTMDISSSSNAGNLRPNANAATDIDSARKSKEIVQYNVDAGLLAEFESSDFKGKIFNYTKSVVNAPESVPDEQISAYLTRMQRGGLIQPFGCLIVIEEPSFRILSYSENCCVVLGLDTQLVLRQKLGLIGVDAKTLFTPTSGVSLVKAVDSREISLLNPIWVYSRATQKPFYAILHRIDVGIVIDLEPAQSGDPALSLAGAVQSQKLAVRAISRLQALPGGDIAALCDTVVEDVQKLTGYDRVMVYKFHEDGHGEVMSEIRRSDLEPFLGLHYPSTDIPLAARFLFKQNRTRIICDCNAKPVRIIQSEELRQPVSLVNSTLRQPHGCHTQYMANMKSIASLAMAVVVNNNEASTSRLWGLVVCHHTTARYVPFTLRYACEFLMQALGSQINMELQLAAQIAEKQTLRTQTLLCDMLLRDAPFGIVTQSPSIKDLVKCEGAALYYKGSCWLLGVTPTESQVKDIVEWLRTNHGESTGLSTDSLADAGYPGAALLGDAVCGMATARINGNDYLFWFRSHIAEEIKWGGAKHHPKDKDDGERMHPRSSFKAFLEVVKSKSLPWGASEIDAIHSLQLIMRDSFKDMDGSGFKASNSQQIDNTKMQGMQELSSVACEMVKLIETATVPIFGVDSSGLINGWNEKIAELVSLPANEAMGKSLVDDLVHEDSLHVVRNILSKGLQGVEEANIELKMRNFGAENNADNVVYIVANTCTSRDYAKNVVGVTFVGQDVTREKFVMDRFIRLQGDYKAIIQSLNPLIPPIFASDENARCSEWNAAMEKLTGWTRDEVIGRVLLGEIFGNLCRLDNQDSLTKFMITLYRGISGQDIEKFPLEFLDRNEKMVKVFLTANKRTDAVGNPIGCFCFLQTASDPYQASKLIRKKERDDVSKLKELAYLRQEMKNPLNGIRFTHKLLESTGISEHQKQFLEASDACERQIMMIVEGNLGSIEEGTLELNIEEFQLGNVLDAVVSQVMLLLREKKLKLYHEIPEEIKSLCLYGDYIRLQLVLSDFLLNIVRYTPTSKGWVEIKISSGLKIIQDGNEFIRLQFRMSHPGEGIPNALIQDMVESGKHWTSQEGLGLNLSRKLLSRMNGQIKYIRENDKCYFLIDVEFKTRKERQWGGGTRVDLSRMT
ncbi:hypothetical protein CsatA_024177 [Cannabis sativa]